MVGAQTLQEYGAVVESNRQALEQARQSAQSANLTFSQQQLRGTSPVQRQMAMQQFEQSRREALGQIEAATPGQVQDEQQLAKARQVEDYNSAVRSVQKAYEKGKLWAVAAFGDPLQKRIAKDFIKDINAQRYEMKDGKVVDIYEGKWTPTSEIGIKELATQRKQAIINLQQAQADQKKFIEDITKAGGGVALQRGQIESITLGGQKYTPSEWNTMISQQQGLAKQEKLDKMKFRQEIYKATGYSVPLDKQGNIRLMNLPTTAYQNLLSRAEKDPALRDLISRYGAGIVEVTQPDRPTASYFAALSQLPINVAYLGTKEAIKEKLTPSPIQRAVFLGIRETAKTAGPYIIPFSKEVGKQIIASSPTTQISFALAKEGAKQGAKQVPKAFPYITATAEVSQIPTRLLTTGLIIGGREMLTPTPLERITFFAAKEGIKEGIKQLPKTFPYIKTAAEVSQIPTNLMFATIPPTLRTLYGQEVQGWQQRLQTGKDIFNIVSPYVSRTASVMYQQEVQGWQQRLQTGRDIFNIAAFMGAKQAYEEKKREVMFGIGVAKAVAPVISYGVSSNIKAEKSKLMFGLGVAKAVAPIVSFEVKQRIEAEKNKILFGMGVAEAGIKAVSPYAFLVGREVVKERLTPSPIERALFFGGKEAITKASPYIIPFGKEIIRQAIPTRLKIAAGLTYEGIKRAPPYITAFAEVSQTPQKLAAIPFTEIGAGYKRETNVFEPAGKKVLELEREGKTKELYDKYGIITVLSSDKKTGQLYYKFENEPEWFKQLRPGFETRQEKEALVPWFLRKTTYGVEKTFSELAQRTFKPGPTIFQPSRPVYISAPSKTFGKVAGATWQIGLYTVPYVKGVAFFGGTAEAITRGPSHLIQYTKENPWEVAMAGVYGAAKGYQFYRYATQPVTVQSGWIAKPRERLFKVQEAYPITDKSGKVTWYGRYGIVQKFDKGISYTFQEPRYATWLEKVELKTPVTKEGLFFMPKETLEKGLLTKSYQPRTRFTETKLFKLRREAHIAKEYKSIEEIPKLYKVEGEGTSILRKTIIPKVSVLSPSEPNVIKSTRFNRYVLKMGNKVLISDEYKKSYKYLLQTKTKVLSKYETEFYNVVREKATITPITPSGRVKFVTPLQKFLGEERIMKGLTKVYKSPFEKVGVYTVLPSEGGVSKSIAKQLAVKPGIESFNWLGTGETAVKPTEASAQVLEQISKQAPGIAKTLKSIPTQIPKVITITAPKIASVTKPEILSGVLTGAAAVTKVLTLPKQVPETKQIAEQSTKFVEKLVEEQKQIPTQVPASDITQSLKQVPAQIVTPIQIPVLVPIQIPAQIPAQTPPSIPRATPPTIPQYALIPPGYVIKRGSKGKPPKRVPGKVFIPFGRRYGRFRPIGPATPYLETAKTRGFAFLKGTLGATFEVRTPQGERIPIAKGLPRELRPGKKGRDIFQVVQTARTRLGTRSERLEIISARKAGRIKFL